MLSALEDPPQELAELRIFCSPTSVGDAVPCSTDDAYLEGSDRDVGAARG
jgi:hypothetical protein